MSAIMRSIVGLAGLVLVSSIGGIVGFNHAGQPSNSVIALAIAHEPAGTNSAASSAALQDKSAGQPACLDCHGPYKDLVAKAPAFKVDADVLINPHQYLPHKSEEVIPECANCHVEHPIPPTGPVKKPEKVKWCYDACHHQQNFVPCIQCHIDKG